MFITRNKWMILMSCILLNSRANALTANDASVKQAIFAGGCFWCMEKPFDELPGVLKTISGYTGGVVKNPSYEQVSSGTTGHFEAIQIIYDPAKVSYEKLLDVFWHNIDPTDDKGQFCDKGNQYRSAIFYQGDQQRLAEQSKALLEKSKPFREPVLTLMLPAAAFFPAKEYHQDYYQKNPLRYRYYRFSCGRDQRLESVWGQKHP
jgi:peptide-methionine (S)-S-oxide reductase